MYARAQTPLGFAFHTARVECAKWVSSNSKTCGLRPPAPRALARQAAARGRRAAAVPELARPRHDRGRPVVRQRPPRGLPASAVRPPKGRPSRINRRVRNRRGSRQLHRRVRSRRHQRGRRRLRARSRRRRRERPRRRRRERPRGRSRQAPGRRPTDRRARASISIASCRRSSRAPRCFSRAGISCNRCRDSRSSSPDRVSSPPRSRRRLRRHLPATHQFRRRPAP